MEKENIDSKRRKNVKIKISDLHLLHGRELADILANLENIRSPELRENLLARNNMVLVVPYTAMPFYWLTFDENSEDFKIKTIDTDDIELLPEEDNDYMELEEKKRVIEEELERLQRKTRKSILFSHEDLMALEEVPDRAKDSIGGEEEVSVSRRGALAYITAGLSAGLAIRYILGRKEKSITGEQKVELEKKE